MRAMTAMTLLILFLSGCGAKGGSDDEGEIVDEEAFGEIDVSKDKGVIRGIVLDTALAPVVEATVELSGKGESVQTESTGVFVFLDLEPGPYFIKASKPGWTSTQQSVDVVAGLDDPAITKIVLEKMPGTEPRAFTQKQDGFISCSIGTPLTFHSCNDVTQEEQKSRLFVEMPGRPQWVQTELEWESTQAAGDFLYVIHGICSCDGGLPPVGGSRFNETPDATSVYIARAWPSWLADNDAGGANGQVVVDVSASGPEPQTTNGSGIALNQDFSWYVTLFYNFDPDPSWSFVADGEYPVPE